MDIRIARDIHYHGLCLVNAGYNVTSRLRGSERAVTIGLQIVSIPAATDNYHIDIEVESSRKTKRFVDKFVLFLLVLGLCEIYELCHCNAWGQLGCNKRWLG